MRPFLAVVLALLCHPAFGQITIQPTSKMGDALIAKLEIPEVAGATNTVEITSDAGTKFVQYGNDLPTWPAAPGAHWLQAVVKTQIHETFDYLEPGPNWPATPTDIVKKSRTVLVDKYEKTYRAEFTVDGLVPPKPPGPGPKPVPTPDDPWGLKDTVMGVTAALSEAVKSQCPQTAALFNEAAAKLESGEFGSIQAAAVWLQTERKKLWGSNASEWAPVENAFGEVWNANWPLNKAQVITFYRLVAAGLEGVQ